MFFNSSGMGQDLHKNIYKICGVRVYIINGRVTRNNLMIDHTVVIPWNIKLLQELSYTGNQIKLLLFTDPAMFGLMNIILVSPYKSITLHFLYYFNKILKVMFIIQTSST